MASAKPTPMCRLMLACEGTNLTAPARIAKGSCSKCEEAIKRREERKLQQQQAKNDQV